MRASGCAVTAALEGSRPLLCEVQAIATPAASSSPAAFGGGAGGFGGGGGGGGGGGAFFMPPKHRQNGIDADRFHLLLAVLGKRANLPISRSDLFVNVVGTLWFA